VARIKASHGMERVFCTAIGTNIHSDNHGHLDEDKKSGTNIF
jgi:hypothetical protein